LPAARAASSRLETGVLILYGNRESGNVYKVRLLLAQLDIAHRRIDVAQFRGEPRTSAFRAINPIGKVPAIRFDDGRVLSESGAILFYFAHGTPLLPEAPWDMANVLRWMFFEQYSHEPYIGVNGYILGRAPEAERARLIGRVADNHERGQHALSVMGQHLRENLWFAAGRYTIADIALYAYSHNADEAGFDLSPYQAVRRWLDRVRTQPKHITQMEEDSAVTPAMFTSALK
jgi:glutathione S-transferase